MVQASRFRPIDIAGDYALLFQQLSAALSSGPTSIDPGAVDSFARQVVPTLPVLSSPDTAAFVPSFIQTFLLAQQAQRMFAQVPLSMEQRRAGSGGVLAPPAPMSEADLAVRYEAAAPLLHRLLQEQGLTGDLEADLGRLTNRSINELADALGMSPWDLVQLLVEYYRQGRPGESRSGGGGGAGGGGAGAVSETPGHGGLGSPAVATDQSLQDIQRDQGGIQQIDTGSIENGSFEEGWTDVRNGAGINFAQVPAGWQADFGDNPPEMRVLGHNHMAEGRAMVGEGNYVTKIFRAEGPFDTTLSTGITGGEDLHLDLRLHEHPPGQELPADAARLDVMVDGQVVASFDRFELGDRTWQELTVDADALGLAEGETGTLSLRFVSDGSAGRDFFIDDVRTGPG